MSVNYLYVSSDWRLDVVVFDIEDIAVESASVDAKILDNTNNTIGDTISLTHKGNGLYQGWFSSSINIKADTMYDLLITVIADGKTSTFKQRVLAKYKTMSTELNI